ncbi:hypothetical protein JT359_17765 [Candidatus Poribacteria bacterium]|nr:hypothetical protein [Candidatus Poribacteria bacterium]
MIQELIVNKWILGGLCFLVIFSGICYLFHEHTIASFSRQLTETDVRSQLILSKNDQIKRQPRVLTPEIPNSEESLLLPAENKTEDTDMFMKDVVQDDIDVSTEQRLPKSIEKPVSFNGFGPFPEIPADYPAQNIWDHPESLTVAHELLLRVQIKLWKQGIHALGGAMKDGKIYVNIPGTVYVEWKDRVKSDGTVERYATGLSGDSEAGKVLRDIIISKGVLTESDLPPGIKIIDSSDGGIDPYQFLDLN